MLRIGRKFSEFLQIFFFRGKFAQQFVVQSIGVPLYYARGALDQCGASCSLPFGRNWTLGHAGYPLGRDDSGVDALLAIRSYVARFFSCRECASHFGSMAKDIESEVRTSHDAVMWLWRAHNRVNARLAGDLSEDPLHPKRPFPPPALCEDCREGSQWDEQRVVAFLLRFYAPTGVAPLGRFPLALLALGLLLVLALGATACARRRLCLALWKALHRWRRLPTRHSSYAARLA